MDLLFQTHPAVTFATNEFVNVPIILQWETIPLVEICQIVSGGYGARINVYNKDGAKIAVVKGSQIYLTKDGEKSSFIPRFEPNLTALTLDGKTILELRRDKAVALKGSAELYTDEGILVRAVEEGVFASDRAGSPLRLKGFVISGNVFANRPVGIHATKNGIAFGGFVDPSYGIPADSQ
jgi:hypothetical protein